MARLVGPSRRGCIGQLAGLGALACLPLAGRAQAAHEPGYQLSDWPRKAPTPALDVLNLQGQRMRLADFRGRVVALNFWASWCEPCRAEMPSLQDMATFFGAEVAVLALNFKEPPGTVQNFVTRTAIATPVLLDPLGDTARAWGVKVFPSTVLIDRQGRARQRVQGEVNWTGPIAMGWVERLLKDGSRR